MAIRPPNETDRDGQYASFNRCQLFPATMNIWIEVLVQANSLRFLLEVDV